MSMLDLANNEVHFKECPPGRQVEKLYDLPTGHVAIELFKDMEKENAPVFMSMPFLYVAREQM